MASLFTQQLLKENKTTTLKVFQTPFERASTNQRRNQTRHRKEYKTQELPCAGDASNPTNHAT